ncbi:glucose 1-dehydrogenase [Frondihabitans cladoniiphilus]|uniref:SDR family oxidoreductase n=1 Tax=Frondihabitans cladoniiphilus TaxID=715785 RepID=A0ABP8W787_9MICO
MSDSPLTFQDKVILITGASTGMGRATALALGKQGAKVVLGDLSDAAGHTADEINTAGGTAIFVKTNVADADSVAALVDAAVTTYGRLDGAFNNAGLLPQTAALADQTVEEFDKTIAVDLRGVFLSLKYEITAMLKTGGGSIVNTASVAGVVADPGMSPYAAAKHGVIGLTQAAALDYATQGIRINAIAPGLVATPMTKRWLDDPEKHAALLANSPIGRPAEPEEIAGTVLHLLSDAASFTTGATMLVDGGQTAH